MKGQEAGIVQHDDQRGYDISMYRSSSVYYGLRLRYLNPATITISRINSKGESKQVVSAQVMAMELMMPLLQRLIDEGRMREAVAQNPPRWVKVQHTSPTHEQQENTDDPDNKEFQQPGIFILERSPEEYERAIKACKEATEYGQVFFVRGFSSKYPRIIDWLREYDEGKSDWQTTLYTIVIHLLTRIGGA